MSINLDCCRPASEAASPAASGLGAEISVCLLTYNHRAVVDSTIRSILEQSLDGYEVIVSDDCSTDGTWERILELAAEDPRIRPVRTPRNVGMAGNANFAVTSCRRPYIALLHHDDLYRFDLLEKWGRLLRSHPDTAFVFNQYGVFNTGIVHRDPMPGECMDGKWFLRKMLLPRWDCVVRGTAMIRRDAWERAGGMRERFGLLADVDLWMRLSRHWRVGYVAEPVITVRHARPDDYPEIYKARSWSWRRRRILHEIHAVNRLETFDLDSFGGRLNFFAFRARLSGNTARSLLYAVVRRRREMLASCGESETPYDLWPVDALRRSLRRIFT